MLPTFAGGEYLKYGENADAEGIKAAKAYWHKLQTENGMKGYELMYVSPMAGIRESYRLIGRYVLTENDIRNPQKTAETIMASAVF